MNIQYILNTQKKIVISRLETQINYIINYLLETMRCGITYPSNTYLTMFHALEVVEDMKEHTTEYTLTTMVQFEELILNLVYLIEFKGGLFHGPRN